MPYFDLSGREGMPLGKKPKKARQFPAGFELI